MLNIIFKILPITYIHAKSITLYIAQLEVSVMKKEMIQKEFLYDCEVRNLSKRTINGYRLNMNRCFRYLEEEYEVNEIEEITGQQLKAFASYLHGLELKETYINSILKAMNSFLIYCLKEGYLLNNPMAKVSYLKEPIPIIITFNDQEVKKMIAYFSGKRFLDVRNKLMMTMFFDTGIRNTELCELLTTDIRGSYILIHGKGNKERIVPISPILQKAIIKYNNIRKIYIKDKVKYQTEYFFLSQKGRMLTKEATEHIVKNCGIACGVRDEIRCSPHTCRHYFAQAQLKNGCDLYTLSRLLGHSDINITKVYLRSIQTDDFLDMTVATSPLMNL